MTWEQIAQALYQILDDIDTEDDHCRENNEAFRKFVMQHQARKNQFMTYGEDRVIVESEIKKRGLKIPDLEEGMLGEARIKKQRMTLPILEDQVEVKNPEDRFREWIRSYDWTLGHVNLMITAEKFGLDEKDVLRIAQEYGLITQKNPYERDIIIYALPSQVDKETGRLVQKQLPLANESKMTDWARNELQMAGLFDKDSDYEGMLGEAVMELVDKFSEQGHSGFSAEMTASIFDRLIHWKPLSELTNDPSEWNEIGEQNPLRTLSGTGKLYQSRRSPSCFSEDGGLTYYDLEECMDHLDDEQSQGERLNLEKIKTNIHVAKSKE